MHSCFETEIVDFDGKRPMRNYYTTAGRATTGISCTTHAYCTTATTTTTTTTA